MWVYTWATLRKFRESPYTLPDRERQASCAFSRGWLVCKILSCRVPVTDSYYCKTGEDARHNSDQDKYHGQGAQLVRVCGACETNASWFSSADFRHSNYKLVKSSNRKPCTSISDSQYKYPKTIVIFPHALSKKRAAGYSAKQRFLNEAVQHKCFEVVWKYECGF